jgi:hypothetical protein
MDQAIMMVVVCLFRLSEEKNHEDPCQTRNEHLRKHF